MDTSHTPTPQLSSVSADQLPWYAVRLFTLRLKAVTEYFREKDLELFVPMAYVDYEDKEGRVKRELRPVVRNLVFIKKTMTQREMMHMVSECPYKVSVIRHSRLDKNYYEIPARQMDEFRLMCNPEVEMRKYVSEEEAKLKAGDPVDVVFGPFKGLSGRLVRQNHKYYLLKEVPGMGVMLKISRWCCKPKKDIK